MTSAILFPLPEEADPLLNRLSGRRQVAASPESSARFVRGRLGEHDVVVGVTGDGVGRASAGVECAIEAFKPTRIVVAGVAGGLSPDLAVGSKILVTRVFDESGEGWRCSVAGLSRVASAAGACEGIGLTSDHLASSAAEKARLRDLLQRLASGDEPGREAMVVDLESSAMVEVAARRGVPWLVLRAVSDGASEELPEFLEACRDEFGGVSRRRVALAAVANPVSVPRLLDLRNSVRARAKELATVIEAVLDAWVFMPEGTHREHE